MWHRGWVGEPGKTLAMSVIAITRISRPSAWSAGLSDIDADWYEKEGRVRGIVNITSSHTRTRASASSTASVIIGGLDSVAVGAGTTVAESCIYVRDDRVRLSLGRRWVSPVLPASLPEKPPRRAGGAAAGVLAAGAAPSVLRLAVRVDVLSTVFTGPVLSESPSSLPGARLISTCARPSPHPLFPAREEEKG